MPLTSLSAHPAHRPDAPVVRLDHVTARYNGGEPALDDVSLTLTAGERVAIGGAERRGQEYPA